MHILVIHQYYLFAGQPGGSRFNEFARMWADAGHRVTVLCGTVNYATGQTPERYQGNWITREKDGAVDVIRCHVPQTYSKSYAGRMWAFFGFTVSATSALAVIDTPDVIVATSPPLIAAIPGFIASRARFRRVPWVFEIRDLWPESAVTTGVLKPDAWLTRRLYQLEQFACHSADRINVLTPAFRDNLIERKLCKNEVIVFVPNGADIEQFSPAPRDNDFRRAMGWGDKIVVMYAGAHGRANAVGQLLDAAEKLKNRSDILIATVGDGPERAQLQQLAVTRRLDNMMFCGPQPKEKMSEVVNACDIGAAVLQNNPTFKTVYPNKVFDYMACERPTLLAIDGVARQLVCDDAQAGLFAEPENADALARAIIELADAPELRRQMGQRGRQWVLANATRQQLSARYLNILKELHEHAVA